MTMWCRAPALAAGLPSPNYELLLRILGNSFRTLDKIKEEKIFHTFLSLNLP